MAKDSTLVLVMGGEAYDGPPKFEEEFDGKPLGEGAIAAAIDTARAGRFADVADKTKYVQSFTFAVPGDVFRPNGDVRIKFLNEAYGGEGSNHDRNLYLASVTVNGRAVTASGLRTKADEGNEPNEMLGEFLVIPDETLDAVSEALLGGWPGTGNEAGIIDLRAPSHLLKVVQITEAAPVSEEPIQTASLDQDPQNNSTSCDLNEVYNVVGFNENSNDLTTRLIERLDQVAADVGDRQCNVQVTGYSSKQGAIASNALFAVERAQNSLKYLQEHGVKFIRASATGVGATDQFGPEFRLNRRVVISVAP
ncbi:MAG: carbohydrate-binding domain-containing protein [Devosia sp.]